MAVKFTRRECLWALGGNVAATASRDLLQEWQRIAAS